MFGGVFGAFCKHYVNFKKKRPVGSGMTAAASAAHSNAAVGNHQFDGNINGQSVHSNAKPRVNLNNPRVHPTPADTPLSYVTAADYPYGAFSDHATPDRRNNSFTGSEQAIFTPAAAVHSAPAPGSTSHPAGSRAAASYGANSEYSYGYDPAFDASYDTRFDANYGANTGRSAPGYIQDAHQTPDLHGYYGDSLSAYHFTNSNSRGGSSNDHQRTQNTRRQSYGGYQERAPYTPSATRGSYGAQSDLSQYQY